MKFLKHEQELSTFVTYLISMQAFSVILHISSIVHANFEVIGNFRHGKGGGVADTLLPLQTPPGNFMRRGLRNGEFPAVEPRVLRTNVCSTLSTDGRHEILPSKKQPDNRFVPTVVTVPSANGRSALSLQPRFSETVSALLSHIWFRETATCN